MMTPMRSSQQQHLLMIGMMLSLRISVSYCQGTVEEGMKRYSTENEKSLHTYLWTRRSRTCPNIFLGVDLRLTNLGRLSNSTADHRDFRSRQEQWSVAVCEPRVSCLFKVKQNINKTIISFRNLQLQYLL